MTTQKHKTKSQSRIRQFLDNLLFTKSFYYHSELSIDEVVQKLHDLQSQTEGFMTSQRYQTQIEHPINAESPINFTLDIQRRSDSGTEVYDTLATASGTISQHEPTGDTVLEGNANIGAAYSFNILIYSIGFFIYCLIMISMLTYRPTFDIGFSIFCWGTFLLAIFAVWQRIFRDRNKLLSDLSQTIQKSKR